MTSTDRNWKSPTPWDYDGMPHFDKDNYTYADDLNDYEFQQLQVEFSSDKKCYSQSDRLYAYATENTYRLENWSDEEVWMYCGGR